MQVVLSFLAIVLVMLLTSSVFAGGGVKIGMILEPPHLDPTAGASVAIDNIVYNNVFEGLMTIDKTGAVKPLLATSWKVSSDFTEYTFKLHKNVVFHNGEKLNADTVVFSFNRILKKDSTNPRAKLYVNIKSVTAVSKNTVKITLKKPSTRLLYILALPDAVIVGKTTHKTNKTKPVGTGPFVFDGSKKGYYVNLKKLDNYYGTPAHLSTVQYKFYPDSSQSTASLLSGGVDAFPFYKDTLSVPVLKAKKSLTVIVGTTEGETIIAINNEHPMLKDIRVRRALNHAINKDEIISVILQGRGEKIGSHFPPHNLAYTDLSNVYPYDLDKAMALLKSAGAENLTLNFTVPPSYSLLAELISAQLRRVGITVVLKKVDWATWLSDTFKARKYDISVVTHLEANDYDIYGNKDYYFAYDSDKFRTLLAKSKTILDAGKQVKILQDIQKTLSEDAVNVWMYQLPKIGVWNTSLTGFWHNAPVEGIVLRNVKWSK